MMDKKELFRRYLLFVISLFFSALGVAVTKRGGLGVSPISSVANVLSFKFSALSMGTWLIIWNCVLIAGQVVLLRRKFKAVQLLQIPLSFLFGYFTDIGVWLASFVPVENYIMQMAMVVSGVVILGFGISLSVIADVIMNSGEAFVKALSDTSGRSFGNVKIAFDISCVLTSVVMSLLFFDFTVVGVREGTLIAAVGTGTVVKFFCRILHDPIDRRLKNKAAN